MAIDYGGASRAMALHLTSADDLDDYPRYTDHDHFNYMMATTTTSTMTHTTTSSRYYQGSHHHTDHDHHNGMQSTTTTLSPTTTRPYHL